MARKKTPTLPKVDLTLPKKYEKALPRGAEILKSTSKVVVASLTHAECLEVQEHIKGIAQAVEKPAEQKKLKEVSKEISAAVKASAEATSDVMSMDLKQHPIGAVFPKISDDQMKDIVASMKKVGYIPSEPIYLYEGMILDGWHRYQAAQKAKVQPVFKDFTGPSAVDFVMSLNLHQRHLTDDQRSIIPSELDAIQGGDQDAETAAASVSVTASKANRAKRVASKSKKLADAVKSGELKLIEAQRIVDDPELLEKLEKGFDGKLSELVEQAYETAKAGGDIRAPSIKLEEKDGWHKEELVYDADGHELGEAWVRPAPLPIDELSEQHAEDFIASIKKAVDGKPDKALIRKALKTHLRDHEVAAVYYDFHGKAPEDDMSVAKVRGSVTKSLADEFTSPVEEDGKADEEIEELPDELEEGEDE